MAKRTAKDFSRNMVNKIATKYAQTSGEYSYNFFCREYGVTKHTFYAILERAIIQNIVSLDIATKIAAKAKANSEEKAGVGAGIRSERHYEYLFLKRKEYALNESESIMFTQKYADSKLPKNEFCEANYISVELLNRTIFKVIAENFVEDDIVAKLKEKSLEKDSSEQVVVFWKNLEQSRNENRKNRE